MRKAIVVSGKYGGLQAMMPMLQCFGAVPEQWKVGVLLCDQHWHDPAYMTLHFPPNVTPIVLRGGSFNGALEGRQRSMAAATAALSMYLHCPQPDVVIVYGDRLDALLGATFAHEMGIPVAHLQAGDLTGGIDNKIRYAISSLATYLFCSTQAGKARVERLCLPHQTISVVGDHHIDTVAKAANGRMWTPASDQREEPYVLVHMHPDTLMSYRQNLSMMNWVVDEVAACGKKPIFLAPCRDLHFEAIHEVLAQKGVQPLLTRTLDQFVELLLGCWAFVGNSSAVAIDGPFLGVPCIPVGHRQDGRTWSCDMPEQLRQLLDCPPTGSAEYLGDGTAGQQTFSILNERIVAR